MPILNYTTEIDCDKSAAEISKCLAQHGAMAIMTEYDKESSLVSAISFKIEGPHGPMGFRLPCDWRPVLKVLERQKEQDQARGRRSRINATQVQAVRTAWRVVKDWVEAQMAFIETQMVTNEQVFLPYAVMRDGRTLAERIHEDPQFLLGDGK